MKTEIAEFMKDLTDMHREKNTITAYGRTLGNFDTLINKPINQVTPEDIKAFINAPANGDGRKRQNCFLKISSQRQHLDRLHKFFEYHQKKITENPVTRVRKSLISTKKKTDEPTSAILTPVQIGNLIRIIPKKTNDRIIFVILYKTGMREGELRNLDLSDISPVDQSLTIRNLPGNKTGYRKVYLDSEGWDELQSYRIYRNTIKTDSSAIIVTQRKQRISNLHVWQTVKKWGDIAAAKYNEVAYENLHPHTLRHAFTTHLNPVDGYRCHIKALQLLRGDSDKSMIDHYTHLTDEQVRSEYLKSMPRLNL